MPKALAGELGKPHLNHINLLFLEEACIADALRIQEATLREVVEWADKVCMEHGMRKHRRCDKCWQAKLKEWGIDQHSP